MAWQLIKHMDNFILYVTSFILSLTDYLQVISKQKVVGIMNSITSGIANLIWAMGDYKTIGERVRAYEYIYTQTEIFTNSFAPYALTERLFQNAVLTYFILQQKVLGRTNRLLSLIRHGPH
jgi:hypothetical protein